MKKTIMAAMFAFILLLPIKLAFCEEKLIIINLFEDERSRTTEAKMKEVYPGLQIEYRWVEDRYTLTTHFLSMDSEMDIVCFNEWDGIKGMYAAMEGALENLADHPSLVSRRDEQFAVWKNYTVGGLWYGVPHTPYQSLVFLNEALFEKTGLPLPDTHWTWDDFWALTRTLEEYNSTHQTRYALFMDSSRNSAAAQYAANTVDYLKNSHAFDDPAFYRMAEKWKELFDRGLIWDYMSNRNQGGIYQESDTLMLYSENPLNAVLNFDWADTPWSRYGVRLLPQSDRLLPSMVLGFELAIPAASLHKELAVQWLAYYMDAGKTEVLNNPLWANPLYKGEEYVSAVKSAMRDAEIKEDSMEKLDLWFYGLEHSRLNPYNELQHAVTVKYWWQMRDGQITAQDYVDACVRFANQYLGE